MRTPGPWVVYDLGMAEWARSPFNPWRRLLVTTERPANAGPEVKFGHVIARIERGIGEHEAAEADAAAIAALPALEAERDHLRSALKVATDALEEVRRDHARDRASHRKLAADALAAIQKELHGDR